MPAKKMYGETMLADIPPRLTTDEAKVRKSVVGKTLSTKTTTTSVRSAKILLAKQELKKVGWPSNYVICKDSRDLGRIAREISLTKEFAFDTETSSLNPWTGELYCSSIYVNGVSYLVNFSHPLLPRISIADYKSNLGYYFLREDIRRYGFNLNFDCHFHEEQAGIACGPFGFDSELASWLIRTDLKDGVRALKPLCALYLGIDKPGYKELYGDVAWIVVDPELSAYYACGDAEMHYLLGKKFEEILAEMPVVEKLHKELEAKVQWADYEEEREGFLIDEEYLRNELAPQLDDILTQLKIDLLAAGMPVDLNPNSPDQMAKFLFETLGMPKIRGTSTDKHVLAELKTKHPAVSKFLEWRETSKLKGTYVDGFLDLLVDSKIHPSSRTIGSTTGRSSSSRPNLYNIPIKVGPVIRKAFIADKDEIIVSKDLKGQELRLQAHFTGPGFFRDTVLRGLNYEEAAAIKWGGKASDYTKDPSSPNYKKRQLAKIALLSLQYGAQANNLSETFDCPKTEAQKFLDDYYLKYPELYRFQQQAKAFAKANGYVQTILGRRCHTNFNRAFEKITDLWELERFAVNAPTQGSAADQIKLAFLLCRQYLKMHKKKTRCRFRIHDELVFYYDKEEFKDPQLNKDLDNIIAHCLDGICTVPFEVETEVYGGRWGMKEDED